MTGQTRLAGILARTPLFQRWVAEKIEVCWVSADEAAEYIRIICDVDSRRDIETNAHAAHLFEHEIRRAYFRWREQQDQTLC
jgi:hypothetical protein